MTGAVISFSRGRKSGIRATSPPMMKSTSAPTNTGYSSRFRAPGSVASSAAWSGLKNRTSRAAVASSAATSGSVDLRPAERKLVIRSHTSGSCRASSALMLA
jgi:hypothetical protein